MNGASILLVAALLQGSAGGQTTYAQAGTAQGKQGLQEQRAAALAAYDAGETAAARSALERLAPSFPHDFAVQEALGLAQAESGDARTALPHLAEAAQLQPNDAGAQANLGAALLATGQYPAAAAALRRATQLDGSNPQTLATLGRALFLQGASQEAAKTLGRASHMLPDDGELRYDWLVALDASHQREAALTAMEQLPPAQRTVAIESLWGDVAEHAGHFQAAVEHMQVAAQREPTEATLYALTVEYLRHWTWVPARQTAEFGVSSFPGSQRLLFAKGVALYGNTQFTEAAGVFGELLRRDPANASYGDLLGRSCAALGGGQAPSCQALVTFAEAHPENARVAVFAAISILHQPEAAQDLGKAEALLQTSLKRDPGFPEAWYQLGVLQQQKMQWDQSAASLRRAIELRPGYAEAHYRLSRAYAHTGQKDEAMAQLALQKQYAQQEKESADAQLKEVTVFLTDSH